MAGKGRRLAACPLLSHLDRESATRGRSSVLGRDLCVAVHSVDSLDPNLGVAELFGAWQKLRTFPNAHREVVPASRRDSVDELLAQTILFHLHIETRELGKEHLGLAAM